MKPGKPLTFATLEATNGHKMLVFGLPGNPVSALVCFYITVVPAIRKLAGWKEPHLRYAMPFRRLFEIETMTTWTQPRWHTAPGVHTMDNADDACEVEVCGMTPAHGF